MVFIVFCSHVVSVVIAVPVAGLISELVAGAALGGHDAVSDWVVQAALPTAAETLSSTAVDAGVA